MTNQTRVFSFLDIDIAVASATVAGYVNGFIASGIGLGYSNFCIHNAVITPQISSTVIMLTIVPPATPPDPTLVVLSSQPLVNTQPNGYYWCTVEVTYYDATLA